MKAKTFVLAAGAVRSTNPTVIIRRGSCEPIRCCRSPLHEPGQKAPVPVLEKMDGSLLSNRDGPMMNFEPGTPVLERKPLRRSFRCDHGWQLVDVLVHAFLEAALGSFKRSVRQQFQLQSEPRNRRYSCRHVQITDDGCTRSVTFFEMLIIVGR